LRPLSFNLNQQAVIPNALAATTALHGYTLTHTAAHQQHVNFVSGSNNHIYELYFDLNTHWHLRDLTDVAVPKATMFKVGSQLSGYQTTWDSSQHVNFIDTNARISELYRVR
jgi:hypothetical protein